MKLGRCSDKQATFMLNDHIYFVAMEDDFPKEDLGWHFIGGLRNASGIRWIRKNIMLEFNWK